MLASKLGSVNLARTRRTKPELNPELSEFLEKHYRLYGPFKSRTFGSNGNNNFVLKSSESKVLLREYNLGTSIDEIIYEHSILDCLVRNRFPVAAPIPTRDGKHFFQLNDRYYTIFEFVNGITYQDYYSTSSRKKFYIVEAGRKLASYHRTMTGFHTAIKKPWPSYEEEKTKIHKLSETIPADDNSGSFNESILNILEDFKSELTSLIEKVNSESEKFLRLEVHGEFTPDNVIFREKKIVAVVNFSQAHHGLRAYDVILALTTFSRAAKKKFDYNKMRLFLKAYGKIDKLPKSELAIMPEIYCLDRLRGAIRQLERYYLENMVDARTSFFNYLETIRWLQENSEELRGVLLG